MVTVSACIDAMKTENFDQKLNHFKPPHHIWPHSTCYIFRQRNSVNIDQYMYIVDKRTVQIEGEIALPAIY